MERVILFLLLSLASLTLSAQSIDVNHIKLTLQFDWNKKQAMGSEEITLTLLKPDSVVYLDAGFLSIESIYLTNTPCAFLYRKGDTAKNLKISLNHLYAQGEVIHLLIKYHTNHENTSDPNAIGGSFGKGLRFMQPTFCTPTKRKQIWSSGEPEGNKYWFPCNEALADLHTMELIAIVDSPLQVISNGQLKNVSTKVQGSRTYHYETNVPLPNFLVFIVVGEFSEFSQQAGSTSIHHFVYPQEIEAAKATTELLPAMMKFMEEKTGYPYPLREYKQIVIQDYPFPGLVGQTGAAILSDNYIDDYGVHRDYKYLWDGVAVQALANQWFGNLMLPKEWKDIWLANAFGQYFAGLFTEKDNGHSEYLLWYYPFEKASHLGDWQAGNKHAIVSNEYQDLLAFTQDSYSKYKGALVLRMLHHELGDDLWWKAIKYFVTQHAHKQITTQDFQQAIESVSGKSFQWFFEQWVYKTGLPKFKYTTSYNPKSKSLLLSVFQEQTKGSAIKDSSVNYFQGKMVIEIEGALHTVKLKPQRVNNYTFRIPYHPQWVNFNFEDKFLCEEEVDSTQSNSLLLFQQSHDVLAKQDALNKLISLYNDTLSKSEIKRPIRNALLNEVTSPQYWRYRMMILNALSKIPTDSIIEETLIKLIKKEHSWVKATALSILGKTRKPQYNSLYFEALNDASDRVINAAAIALGKSKDTSVFNILLQLEQKKSWKNQQRIAALNGFKELGDSRAATYAFQCLQDSISPRWYLGTPAWDYPFTAVNTLVALGYSDWAFPLLLHRFHQALNDNDLNDIFQQVQLLNMLKDKRCSEIYITLKVKYASDESLLQVIDGYEKQFLENLNG